MRIYFIKWKSLILVILLLILVIYYYLIIKNYDNLNDDLVLKANISIEIDIYAYSAFTKTIHFPAEPSIYKRNIELLSGQRLVDLHNAIRVASKALYLNEDNFKMGFYRVTPFDGYQYQLNFRRGNECCDMIELKRQMGTYKKSELKHLKPNSKEIINFIVPLWGEKSAQLSKFLSMFERVAIKDDSGFSTLTLVYIYNPHKLIDRENKAKIDKALLNYNFKIKKIFIESSVKSRGKALQIGVENNDGLLFFCDVDVIINQEFLHFCRVNSEKGRKVYYPILYSFYNPQIVTKFDKESKLMQENLLIKKDTGFWRDIGFGMTCQYKEDFVRVNGFNEFIQSNTWGDEDLALYRKHIRIGTLEIMRAITPGIFHLYHEKKCIFDGKNIVTYTHCLESKVLNEASQKHLGFLHFNYLLIK